MTLHDLSFGYPPFLTASGAPAKGYPYPSLEAPRPCGAPLGLNLYRLRYSAASEEVYGWLFLERGMRKKIVPHFSQKKPWSVPDYSA